MHTNQQQSVLRTAYNVNIQYRQTERRKLANSTVERLLVLFALCRRALLREVIYYLGGVGLCFFASGPPIKEIQYFEDFTGAFDGQPEEQTRPSLPAFMFSWHVLRFPIGVPKHPSTLTSAFSLFPSPSEAYRCQPRRTGRLHSRKSHNGM